MKEFVEVTKTLERFEVYTLIFEMPITPVVKTVS